MSKIFLSLIFAASTQAQDVSLLSFLTGCWSMSTGPMVIEEEWGRPSGDGMLGFSRTLQNGKTAFSEFMRIEKQGASLIYTPRIGTKQAPVSFTMTKLTDTEVIFENPAHDFPQRIIYWRDGERLCARVEGTIQGKLELEESCWTRAR